MCGKGSASPSSSPSCIHCPQRGTEQTCYAGKHNICFWDESTGWGLGSACDWRRRSSANIRDTYTAIQVFDACRVLVSYRLSSIYCYRWPLVFSFLLVPLIYLSLSKRQSSTGWKRWDHPFKSCQGYRKIHVNFSAIPSPTRMHRSRLSHLIKRGCVL